MKTEQNRLAGKIRAMIAAGPEGDASQFESIALDIFSYQYQTNAPYKEFCDVRGVTPDDVKTWRSIPAFPTDSFKSSLVTSFPAEEAVMANLTSGTSANVRGQIFRDKIGKELIFSANRMMTEHYLFPDLKTVGQNDQKKCQVLILAPSPEMAPSMGMAQGMEETRVRFGADNSQFLLTKTGIDIKAMVAALTQAESSGQPVAFIGATGAFVYFFKACEQKGLRFRLPKGSRIGDGGGYRGRFGKVDRQAFFDMAQDILGIPASHCINVLGMAESATNFFENPLRESVNQLPDSERRFIPPPWTRVDVVDATNLQPLPPGKTGLLRHFDLANLPTVMAVQTDNLGQLNEDGSFTIIGRAKTENGKVSMMPDERTVGPMGDNRIFRFLENYVNFSIRFKMWGVKRNKTPQSDDLIAGGVCTCADGIEQLVAAGTCPHCQSTQHKS